MAMMGKQSVCEYKYVSHTLMLSHNVCVCFEQQQQCLRAFVQTLALTRTHHRNIRESSSRLSFPRSFDLFFASRRPASPITLFIPFLFIFSVPSVRHQLSVLNALALVNI